MDKYIKKEVYLGNKKRNLYIGLVKWLITIKVKDLLWKLKDYNVIFLSEVYVL
jgi:hypothetical protein